MNGQIGVSKQVGDQPVSLTGELARVQQEIAASLRDLHAPFSQLVQSRLRTDSQLLCGAFVLTAGVGMVDTPRLTEQRIDLGAAIEVLRLALGVHTQLLGAPEAHGHIDRSLLGSTILAGDFCFSRAAGLAAKTGSPVVVDIFAQALQRVSEGTLRDLFAGREGSAECFDVERELCLSGVAAANELAGLSTPARDVDQKIAVLILDARRSQTLGDFELPQELTATHTPLRLARWRVLLDWLRS